MTTDQQIDAILKEKRRYQDEDKLLHIKKQETGSFTPEEKKRAFEIRCILQDFNGKLIDLGYRKPKESFASNEYLGIVQHMNDIICENFGIQKAMDFEKEAKRRFVENTKNGIFKLMGEKEFSIIESYHQWQHEADGYKDLKKKMHDVKAMLEKQIATETDYSIRKLLTGIFKML